MVLAVQPALEELALRGLAGTVGTFERNQQAARLLAGGDHPPDLLWGRQPLHSIRYDTTVEFTIIQGSAVLQAGFYGMAAVIVVAASLLVKRVRFTVAAVAWVAGVSAASYAGLFMPRGGPRWCWPPGPGT